VNESAPTITTAKVVAEPVAATCMLAAATAFSQRLAPYTACSQSEKESWMLT
jgi:hypothetical protein